MQIYNDTCTYIYVYITYNIHAYNTHIYTPWKTEYWKTLNGYGNLLCANYNRIGEIYSISQ